MIKVKLYTRKDCHLCDEAKGHLDALQESIPHQLEIIDIDNNRKLRKQYGELIPVIEVGPYQLKAPIDRKELEVTLSAARIGIEQDEAIDEAVFQSGAKGQITWTRADSFTSWLSRHYLALINLFVFVYLSIPFFAPVLMNIGMTQPAYIIYRVYSTVCHQLAYRSWFLFGEQYAYPKEDAGVDRLMSYEEATGMDSSDLLAARRYIGDTNVGYKVALCERDVAIYLSILLFGLIFAITGRKLAPFPAILWVLLGLVPIALDGFSQLLSQPPFSLIPYRESTPFLRTLTGFLFGFTSAWFGIPMVESTMADAKKFLEKKRARYKASPAPGD